MHNTENERSVNGEATNLDMAGLGKMLDFLYRFVTEERKYIPLPDMPCGLMQHTPEVEIIEPLATSDVVEPESEAGNKHISHEELRDKGLLTGASLAARFPKEYEAAVVEARELTLTGAAGAALQTGIRFDDDAVPMFQTRYVCGSCGNRGKRFVFNKSQYCKCHNCPTRMRIEYASNKNLRDQYGNYYKAVKEHGE
jgi:hypothetical protein